MCPFSTEEAPFSYTFYWQMVPPFHIPSLERYIPFNCPFSPSYSEYHISLPLHGHLPQLVKSLPFHIPETWKRCPLRAEPPRTGHYREYPPDPLSSVLSIYCDSKEKKETALNLPTLISDTSNRNTKFFLTGRPIVRARCKRPLFRVTVT